MTEFDFGKEVVALKYDGDEDAAPKVIAKGKGPVAQEILAIASEHNIPLQHNAELTALLSQLELGQEIPEALYETVAQILAFIFQLNDQSTP